MPKRTVILFETNEVFNLKIPLKMLHVGGGCPSETINALIIIAYGMLTDEEARTRQPNVVFVDAANHIVQLGADPGDVPLGFGLIPTGIGRS